MAKKLFTIFISFIAAGVLLFIGFKFFVSEAQLKLLFSISVFEHVTAIAFCLVSFIISGFELRYIYSRNSQLKLSNYEIISLPVSMNLWGYLIPFQGAFLYLIAYLKLKHKISVINTTYIYIYVFLLSLSISGLLGIIFYFNSPSVSILFLYLSILLLINPVIIFYSNKALGKIKFSNVPFLRKIKDTIDQTINQMSTLFQDKHVTITMIGFNLLSTLIYVAWSYWVVVRFDLPISFFAILIMSFLLKITLLLKFTPGNLGLIQLASGGIIALLGGNASDGFLISLFQSLTYMLIAFSLGTIFSLINMKYFSWKSMESMLLNKKSIQN